MFHQLLATTYRNNLIEGEHYGSVAVCDIDGKLIVSCGNPDFQTFIRSSLKMVQAIPVVQSGASEKYGFNNAELSICCASHNATSFHLDTVKSMLSKIGLNESNLLCGVQKPTDENELQRVLFNNEKFSQLHNNCSGKHTGMLSACLANNWSLKNYISSEHPLQKEILNIVSKYINRKSNTILTGIDGCSLPTCFLSLSEMATMLAKYTRDAQNDLNPASKIFKSVAKHPEMINDIDGFDTELVRAFNHSAIAKRGAMAVFVVGINTIKYGQIGIAIKLIDGDSTPMPPIVLKVLEKLEVIDSSELEMLQKFRIVEQYNWNKIFTGKICSGLLLNTSSVV